jgi:NTP pyrophosphatase (non-canonical NTP hydrolase)
MKRDDIYAAINKERDRQNAKWIRPAGWTDHNFIKQTVLSEEVGEVAQEVLRLADHDPRTSEADLRDELIQVCAVCVAWLEMLA